MKKKLKILFFCMVFAVGGALAQQMQMINSKQNVVYPPSFLSFQSIFRLSLSGESNRVKNNWLVPGNFYARHLPFICRKEMQLDKVTPLQFRFRLGSVHQCNWLEGKTSIK